MMDANILETPDDRLQNNPHPLRIKEQTMQHMRVKCDDNKTKPETQRLSEEEIQIKRQQGFKAEWQQRKFSVQNEETLQVETKELADFFQVYVFCICLCL